MPISKPSNSRRYSAFDSGRGISTLPRAAFDELLSGFAPYYEVVGLDSERVLRATATDVDESWWLTLGPSGVRTSRKAADADLTVAGRAARPHLELWNRPSGFSIDLMGDACLLDAWRDNCCVVWSR